MNNIPVNIPQANGFILKTQQIQSDSRICERAENIEVIIRLSEIHAEIIILSLDMWVSYSGNVL